jgi:hypothetical protein
MKDIHSDQLLSLAFGPVVLAADNTPVALDLQGYNAAELVLGIGIGGITFDGTNKVEFVLTHSDDNSSYSNVTDADVLGVSGISNGIIKSLIAAHAAATVHRFGYRGNKRYLKLLADFSGTHGTGTALFAAWELGHGHNNPQANQG